MKKRILSFVLMFTIVLSSFNILYNKSEAATPEVIAGVRQFQTYINNNLPSIHLGSPLVADGYFNDNTKYAAVKLLQYMINTDFGAGLAVDGHFGAISQATYKKYIGTIERYRKDAYVYILQGLLYCHGYNPNGFDGSYGFGGGTGCLNAVNLYKSDNGITELPNTAVGAVGTETMASLCWKSYVGFKNIPINSKMTDIIEVSGDVDVFTFYVQDTGYYRFDSIGQIDMRGSLNTFVSGVYTELLSNDDYDYPQNERNFRIYKYLTAGTYVYLDVRGWSSTTGSYQLQITKESAFAYGSNYLVWEEDFVNTLEDAQYVEDSLDYVGFDANAYYNPYRNIFEDVYTVTGRYATDHELFSYNGHGFYGCIRLVNGYYVYAADMPVNCFRSNKISLWFCCLSAATFPLLASVSMVQASINRGSKASLGFENSVSDYLCRKYSTAIIFQLMIGATLADAVVEADKLLEQDNPNDWQNPNSPTVGVVILGDSETRLIEEPHY